MDDPSVKYAQDRFEEIKSEVEKMLTKIGYKTEKISFIPMMSENIPWWKGFSVLIEKDTITGVTLMDALEKTVSQPKRPTKNPFRMPVSGVYNIKGVGDVITGRIEQLPLDKAEVGDNACVNVKKLKKKNIPHTSGMMFIDDPALYPNKQPNLLLWYLFKIIQDN
ncbi:hypothetical protein RFI_39529 [Reticulomyxa filosa]|uniref:Uncharacterized protein n=1 Tax=Reticulomyxa filosa TaxID=46433 RepID=X6L7U9_RETFI|nr:hypothetical protein RFI_39529 [Reticulomyxa filosa]|eukprot:ETN97992.1 hypothetical protein RFI_39529 [Reticulomyxa filosa]